MTFDPAGVYGNNSGTPGATPLIPAKIPEWDTYKALYAMYKVKKIHLKFSAYDNTASGLLSEPPVLYIRYLNQFQTPADNSVNAITISEERNWIRKVFTVEKPTFEYSFYPKIMVLGDNNDPDGLVDEARIPKSMPWTTMGTPVNLFGIKFYYLIPQINTGSCYVSCDVSYDLEFKTQD